MRDTLCVGNDVSVTLELAEAFGRTRSIAFEPFNTWLQWWASPSGLLVLR